ncbi:anthranilate synthase component I family protein [Roseofilum capinflatum]|uniref:Chorismate-binding protein n=1 Tax=Roseofilum capinflatum BLCC-M114 TaxID=3022440 RepID=A0ABT7B057_9CYAN|nr:chorismate-binding protein [Roseofilum capinflatum]MDJ1172525.1 chorismate-binding protein [Roseofilum capinflatum BLCC-M114]
MGRTWTYNEVLLPGQREPLGVLQTLIESRLFSEYGVYQSEEVVRFAGNRAIAVSVDLQQVTLQGLIEDRYFPVDDPLKQVEEALASIPLEQWTAYGYVSFDCVRYYYPYRKAIAGPLLYFFVPATEVIMTSDRILVRTLESPEPVCKLLQDSECRTTQSRTRPELVLTDRDQYQTQVETLQAAIHQGELHKAILSRSVKLKGNLDILGTYILGNQQNQALRSYGLHLPGVRTVGFSPEILMQLSHDPLKGRTLMTNPVAGTRPRGETPEADEQLKRQLFADAKEVKEHALSIWLVQDEMQQVCTPGTVKVMDFMQVKQYRWVQHLSSEVQGQLRSNHSLWDALKVLFPGVTVSGIEKEVAISWIDRLETEPRGIYAGAIGWINSQEEADLAIPIRSAYQYGEWIYLNAGAGIMAESVARNEYIESVNKMNTMLTNLVLES